MADSMCGPSNPLKHVQDHLSRAGQDMRLRSQPSQSSETFRSIAQESSMAAEDSFAEFQRRGVQLDHVPILLPAHIGPGPLQAAYMQPAAFQPVAAAAQPANSLQQHSQAPSRHGASWAAEYAAMAPPSMSRGAEMPAAGPAFLPQPTQDPMLHRPPHQMQAPSYMMGNYGRPMFAPAPTLAAAAVPVDPLADEAERARFDAAFAQLDQEFSSAVDEWDAAHGPDAQADGVAAGMDGLMDRLADQRLEDGPRPQPQQPPQQDRAAASGDPELRAVAGQVAGMLGSAPLFERSQFAQLMRGIEAGTIVVDAAQTNFVDATTLEPVAGSGAAQAGEKPDGGGN
ncbi:hypothetical protein RB594_001933 [Gaeumannomyces avenae]